MRTVYGIRVTEPPHAWTCDKLFTRRESAVAYMNQRADYHVQTMGYHRRINAETIITLHDENFLRVRLELAIHQLSED